MSLRRKPAPPKNEAEVNFYSLLSKPEEISGLLELRFESWKNIVKAYHVHFKQEVDNKEDQLKGLQKSHKSFTSNLNQKTLEHFAPDTEEGILQIMNITKDLTIEQIKSIETQIKDIENVTLKELVNLKNEIKNKNKDFKTEFSSLNSKIIKHRESIKIHYDSLSRAFDSAENKEINAEDDPWLVNFSLAKQLKSNNEEETDYIKNLEIKLNALKGFEKHIISTLKTLLTQNHAYTISELEKSTTSLNKTKEKIISITEENEWKVFLEKNPNYVINNSSTTTKSIEELQHAKHSDDYLKTLKEGPLQIQHGFGMFKSFKEHYFVLTNSGFLHGFSDQDYHKCKEPDYSINLNCSTLGPLDDSNQPKNTFEITQKKEKGKLFKSDQNFLLKSINETDSIQVKEWWEAISKKANHLLVSPSAKNTQKEAPEQNNVKEPVSVPVAEPISSEEKKLPELPNLEESKV